MSTVIGVEYTGAEASCLLSSSPDAKTLSSSIGDVGAESADPAFGAAGVVDLTGLTVAQVIAAIDAYDDYSAELIAGDSTVSAEDILEAQVQAAGLSGYLVFEPTSVLDANALISWDTARTFIGKADDPLSEIRRVYVEKLINAVSARANLISGRLLASRSATVILDGPGGELLLLPEYPVSAISEIRIDTSRAFGSSSVVASSAYFFYADGRLFYPSRFAKSRLSVQVTYTAGYDPVPEDLQLAVIECLAYTWKRLQSKAIGTSSITADGVTTQFEIDIPLPARRVFESYRREE